MQDRGRGAPDGKASRDSESLVELFVKVEENSCFIKLPIRAATFIFSRRYTDSVKDVVELVQHDCEASVISHQLGNDFAKARLDVEKAREQLIIFVLVVILQVRTEAVKMDQQCLGGRRCWG